MGWNEEFRGSIGGLLPLLLAGGLLSGENWFPPEGPGGGGGEDVAIGGGVTDLCEGAIEGAIEGGGGGGGRGGPP